MELSTREKLLKLIEKEKATYSIVLDFEDLVQKGVLERKKGTKTFYKILDTNKFPMQAISQSKECQQITKTVQGKTIKEMFFKFPTDRERRKILKSL